MGIESSLSFLQFFFLVCPPFSAGFQFQTFMSFPDTHTAYVLLSFISYLLPSFISNVFMYFSLFCLMYLFTSLSLRPIACHTISLYQLIILIHRSVNFKCSHYLGHADIQLLHNPDQGRSSLTCHIKKI